MCRQVLHEFCPLSMPIFLVLGSYSQPAKDGGEQKPGYTEGGLREGATAE